MIDSKIQKGSDVDGKAWFRYTEDGSKFYYVLNSKKSQQEAYLKARLQGIGLEVKTGAWDGR